MYEPIYFVPEEFKKCTPSCSIGLMSEDLLIALDKAREISGYPFIVNSAYRSIAWEKAHGRKGTSSHTKGLAVDLHCESAVVRFYMVYGLIKAGFRRIGIYPTFIHADLDTSKVSAIWLDSNSVCRG